MAQELLLDEMVHFSALLSYTTRQNEMPKPGDPTLFEEKSQISFPNVFGSLERRKVTGTSKKLFGKKKASCFHLPAEDSQAGFAPKTRSPSFHFRSALLLHNLKVSLSFKWLFFLTCTHDLMF